MTKNRSLWHRFLQWLLLGEVECKKAADEQKYDVLLNTLEETQAIAYETTVEAKKLRWELEKIRQSNDPLSKLVSKMRQSKAVSDSGIYKEEDLQ